MSGATVGVGDGLGVGLGDSVGEADADGDAVGEGVGSTSPGPQALTIRAATAPSAYVDVRMVSSPETLGQC